MTKKEIIGFSIAVVIFVIVISMLLLVQKIMDTSQVINAILTFALVLITTIYVKRTADIAFAAKQQAEASVKMAEEMREQRIMASRPVIIQKAVAESETELATGGSQNYFGCFEIYNVGNGPAIEVEVTLLNKEKKSLGSERKTFLMSNEKPMIPNPFDAYPSNAPFNLNKLDQSDYYLVAEYQGILSHGTTKTWYQTWLPFKTSKSSVADKIYIISGELEFKVVTEKERIDSFTSGSKPT